VEPCPEATERGVPVTTIDLIHLDAQDALGEALGALRPALVGGVHLPGEPGYVELVTPWNLAALVVPAAVVAPRTGEDVAATVRVAARHRLTVGVQSTGHGAQGAAAADVLVATRHLDELTVHPEEGWVRVGAGLK
jgi:FAD/FMN-containing dehydrogenase